MLNKSTGRGMKRPVAITTPVQSEQKEEETPKELAASAPSAEAATVTSELPVDAASPPRSEGAIADQPAVEAVVDPSAGGFEPAQPELPMRAAEHIHEWRTTDPGGKVDLGHGVTLVLEESSATFILRGGSRDTDSIPALGLENGKSGELEIALSTGDRLYLAYAVVPKRSAGPGATAEGGKDGVL